MAGQKNKELPITATGYQFQSEAELREAYWLIGEGDYKDLDDFGRRMQLADINFKKLFAKKNSRKKAA